MAKKSEWIAKYSQIIQIIILFTTVGIVLKILLLNRNILVHLVNYQLSSIISIFLIFIFQLIFASMPLWLIVKYLSGKSIPIVDWLKLFIVSRMANNILTKSGGVYKAYVLKNNYEVGYTKFVHVYTFFSWLTIFLNLALVAIFILIYMPTLKLGNYSALLLISSLFFATLCGPLVASKAFALLKLKNPIFAGISEKISSIFVTMMEHGRNIKFMSKLIGLLIIKFGLNILLFRLIFYGMNIEIGYAEMALFIAVQQVSIIVFITPGNIGIRELLYGAIGGAVGIGVTEGLMASALLRLVDYMVVFPLGIAFGGAKILRSNKMQDKAVER